MEQLALVERKKQKTHKTHIHAKKEVINAVKAHLVAYPGDKVGDIAKYYGMHNLNVSAHKSRLMRLGLISRDTMVTAGKVSDLRAKLHGTTGKEDAEDSVPIEEVTTEETLMATAKKIRPMPNHLNTEKSSHFAVGLSQHNYWFITGIARARGVNRRHVVDEIVDHYIKTYFDNKAL